MSFKNNIVERNAIRDLHIHSCKSKGSSGEFAKLYKNDVPKFIDDLIATFSKFKDLEMISFTDHNAINSDVYNEFIKRKLSINIIPGIEIDLLIDKDSIKSKHIIFYFDETKFKFGEHDEKINNFLSDYKFKDGSYPTLEAFLEYVLNELKIPFLMSAHYLKQDSKGIEYGKCDNQMTIALNKFANPFYCILETSSQPNIQKAISFLKQFEANEFVRVIHFSDSTTFKNLENYLSNPAQYFKALPTFQGLRLVASDKDRISFEKEEFLNSTKGNFIGKVTVDDCDVYFSHNLNSIIGGRGSGKSLLVDGLVKEIAGSDIISSQNNRLKFLNSHKFKVFNYLGEEIKLNAFKVEYYKQGFVQELFLNESSEIVYDLFKDEFNELKSYSETTTRTNIREQLSFEHFNKISNEKNLISIIENNKISVCNFMNIFSDIPSTDQIIYDDYSKLKNLVDDYTCDIFKDNPTIVSKTIELYETIVKEINKLNKQRIYENFNSKMFNKYNKERLRLDKVEKNKVELKENIITTINNLTWSNKNRVALINKLLDIDFDKFNDESSNIVELNDGKKIIFKSSISVENGIDYLYRILESYIDSTKLKKYVKFDNRNPKNRPKSLIFGYCYYGKFIMRKSKKLDTLDKELTELSNLRIKVDKKILYMSNSSNCDDIKNLSPGEAANILMEYIMNKNSDIPLIIDQPEDNIDKSAIYENFTKWFKNIKTKRQVIVVTHDANIVVNADSENVIISKHKSKKFSYINGALEHADNLKYIANTLEGGKEAIKRRLTKYGE